MTNAAKPPRSEMGHDLRSFGRRRGRKISTRQQRLLQDVLPRVRLDLSLPFAAQDLLSGPSPMPFLPTVDHAGPDPGERPPSPLPRRDPPAAAGGTGARATGVAAPSTIWLEIGFGGAEHLIWQAQHHPDVMIIGCEPFEEGVVKALAAIEDLGLQNVRIHPDDARAVLRWLPADCLERVFILFPDPWPKRKHIKRRLINPATLALLARVMRPGAELRIATDIGDYVRTLLIAVGSHGGFAWQAEAASDWRVRSSDWPCTRYEQKALREGRRGYFFRFRRL